MKKKTRGRIAVGAMSAFLIAAAGGLAFAYWQFGATHVEIDAETLCPLDRDPGAHTVIVVDQTDPLTTEQRVRLRSLIDGEARGMEQFDKLTVLTIDPGIPFEPQRIFSMCAPKPPASVNKLYENIRQAEIVWRRKFGPPLNAALKALEDVPEGEVSPLIEALMAVSWMPDFGPDVPVRRLIYFSDFLQSSAALNVYKARVPAFEAWSATTEGQRLAPDLTGVEAYLVLIPRPEQLKRQSGELRAFWLDLLAASGASAEFAVRPRRAHPAGEDAGG